MFSLGTGRYSSAKLFGNVNLYKNFWEESEKEASVRPIVELSTNVFLVEDEENTTADKTYWKIVK